MPMNIGLFGGTFDPIHLGHIALARTAHERFDLGRIYFVLANVANALPEKLRPAPAVIKPFSKQPAKGDLVLSGARVHLLDSVHQPISATAIRQAAAAKKPLKKFVDPPVEEYIKKIGLYK